MKLTQLRIQNFRSCRDVSLEITNMHALVGANNAGKSTVLRALDFLFNPSTRSLNEESFWNKDTTLEIRVEAVFSEITDKEKEALNAYLKPDGTLHSSLLVDVAYFDEIIRMECAREQINGQKTMVSTAWQLPMGKMIEDIKTRIPSLKSTVTSESMRELYSHAYNPRRNEGFFASKIILVEGLTEEYALPIYAEALPDCAFDSRNISVVECGGKGSMDRLYRVFNELHIPCYILFDYDSGNSDKNIIDKSKELLALAGKPQDAPETLFVEDTIACFPTKWETHLKSEIPDIDTLTAEARKELGLNTDSGKPLVARYVARKITSQDPPIVPASLKTIIEKAVAVSWKGSCLKTQANVGGAEE